jgi:tetratricopeptide (TPR) repeat protein
MDMARMEKRWLLAVFSGLLLFISPPKAVAHDADLRQKALALNDITGDDTMEGEIKALEKDPSGTKKLLAVAVQMTKEKDQPFNYTGAFILARAAHLLKDLEAGKVLYRVCASEADKLKSAEKLYQAYAGLINLLYQNKKPEESDKVSQEFLEKLDSIQKLEPDKSKSAETLYEAYAGLIKLFFQLENYEKSDKLCQEFLEKKDNDAGLEPYKLEVLQLRVGVMLKQGKNTDALKVADALVKSKPDNLLHVHLKGLVEREAGKYDDAAKTWEDLLEKLQKREEAAQDNNEAKEFLGKFVRQVHLEISNVYVDANRIDKATEHLKALLANDPDDPGVNNDLGYIWADHDMNLDEAEKMIRKALDEDRKLRKKENPALKPKEDKDNAAYLDSLGWVLYKKKKYQEAKEPLLKAVADEDGKHIEIYDHLGDIHMALGEKAEAIAIWKKALKLKLEQKREKEIKTKVEKKLKEATGDK